jgi:hypothetical protein
MACEDRHEPMQRVQIRCEHTADSVSHIPPGLFRFVVWHVNTQTRALPETCGPRNGTLVEPTRCLDLVPLGDEDEQCRIRRLVRSFAHSLTDQRPRGEVEPKPAESERAFNEIEHSGDSRWRRWTTVKCRQIETATLQV